MRKLNVLMIVALAIALLATMTFNQPRAASAQDVPHVGIVVAYVPGQSITISDQSGVQHEFQLASSVKMLPPNRAGALTLGSFVTIIAPNSFVDGKQVAVGIVVHPHVPNGWNALAGLATAFPAGTSITTETVTPSGTLTTTETITATATADETTTATPIPTETPAAVGIMTATSTSTPIGGTAGTSQTGDSFIEWLRSLLRQILTNK